MAWEPLVVMIRKLFITLAGSLPRDPYIQISIALTILVGSITLQALVQPYESTLVNVLDVISLFVLSFTQILSILYLYLDTKDGALPYDWNKETLEIVMTVALSVANASVIVLLLVAWIGRITFEKLHMSNSICPESACCRRGRRRNAADDEKDAEEEAAEYAGLELAERRASDVDNFHESANPLQSSSKGGGAAMNPKFNSAKKPWWIEKGIKRGDTFTHPKRGAGIVIAFNVDGDAKVHIEFTSSTDGRLSDSGVHRYKESSWWKMTSTSNPMKRTTRKRIGRQMTMTMSEVKALVLGNAELTSKLN